jgi:hypothetical protein
VRNWSASGRVAGASNMPTKALFRRFRELHDLHKLGLLSPEEAKAYPGLRDELYAALMQAQQLKARLGETARQTVRVAAAKKIHLTIADRTLDTMTCEIGVEGLSAFVDADLPIGSSCDFILSVGGHPLPGEAYVVACVRHGSGGVTHRASFALDAMSDDDRARLEIAVLDAALALLPK